MFTFVLTNRASKLLKETICLANIITFTDSFVVKGDYEIPLCLLREKVTICYQVEILGKLLSSWQNGTNSWWVVSFAFWSSLLFLYVEILCSWQPNVQSPSYGIKNQRVNWWNSWYNRKKRHHHSTPWFLDLDYCYASERKSSTELLQIWSMYH